MEFTLSALVVRNRKDNIFEAVSHEFDALAVSTDFVGTCAEAQGYLDAFGSPLLTLTDPLLLDGDWMDVRDLAIGDRERANVIVFPSSGRVGLYVRVTEGGASDFVESFSARKLNRILRTALEEAFHTNWAMLKQPENFRREPRSNPPPACDGAAPPRAKRM